MKLKLLPPIHEVLAVADTAGLSGVYRTRLARSALATVRAKLLKHPRAYADRRSLLHAVVEETERRVRELLRPFPQRVINATGVVLHTNLGRAPLGSAWGDAALAALSCYSNLEWDAETQKRSSRDRHLNGLLQLVTGADSAIAVNNCASALWLALHTVAAGKDVLVSRSELVEIGGGFRVPEIMEASGCRLVEVGTTNKTRIGDFERKAAAGKCVLLKVHQSNFVQKGFVESVPLGELARLGKRLRVPVLVDNGSGLLDEEPLLKAEPTVEQGLKNGASVVVFSGDKLLGGVQAGIIAGKAALVERMRKDPLYRALRLDKVRLALLHRTLLRYATGSRNALPLWRMATADLESRKTLLRLPAGVAWTALEAQTGGGSNPERPIPSLGLRLSGPAQSLKQRFAQREIPILGYIQGNAFYLDVRTLFPEDFFEVQRALDEFE